jgi:hypothetical protein
MILLAKLCDSVFCLSMDRPMDFVHTSALGFVTKKEDVTDLWYNPHSTVSERHLLSHSLSWRAILTAFEVSNLKVPTKHLNMWRRQAPSGIDLTCAICSCQWWLWPHAWKNLCCTKSCDGRGITMLHVKSWRSSRTNSRFWSDNFLQPRHLHPRRSRLHHSAMFGVTVVHD